MAGCVSSKHAPKPPPDNGGVYRQHNEGYSILYRLMYDESRVGGIFVIKKADDKVKAPIKQLSDACKAAHQRLDDFRRMDHRLEFDVPDLPYMEKTSRDLEAKEDRKLLLFSSGQQFELTLIFTQAQAMNYAVHLCQALEAAEGNPQRKAFLQDLEHQCNSFHDQLMKMLAVNPGNG
ncbi:MAG TPA: hypothetical protein VGG19_03420 [Tepidisphaeraceae bacterium]|jgi:hypothetical protein